jgi:hypothetical protein
VVTVQDAPRLQDAPRPQDARRGLRVLVTGSRKWVDREAIYASMIAQWDEAGRGETTLVHGAAKGADTLAASIAYELGWTVEPYPADWDQFGRAAGPIRNALMVSKGADVCLAFPFANSRGTIDCMRRCVIARIPVIVKTPAMAVGAPWTG